MYYLGMTASLFALLSFLNSFLRYRKGDMILSSLSESHFVMYAILAAICFK